MRVMGEPQVKELGFWGLNSKETGWEGFTACGVSRKPAKIES